jgi:hypothetical protein
MPNSCSEGTSDSARDQYPVRDGATRARPRRKAVQRQTHLHAVRRHEVGHRDEAHDLDAHVGRRVPLVEPVVAVFRDVLLLLPDLHPERYELIPDREAVGVALRLVGEHQVEVVRVLLRHAHELPVRLHRGGVHRRAAAVVGGGSEAARSGAQGSSGGVRVGEGARPGGLACGRCAPELLGSDCLAPAATRLCGRPFKIAPDLHRVRSMLADGGAATCNLVPRRRCTAWARSLGSPPARLHADGHLAVAVNSG